MERDFLKPKEGLLIRDEYTGDRIPPEGREMRLTTIVRKHLRAGDLVRAKKPEEPAEEPKSEPETVSRKRERMVTTTGSEG